MGKVIIDGLPVLETYITKKEKEETEEEKVKEETIKFFRSVSYERAMSIISVIYG